MFADFMRNGNIALRKPDGLSAWWKHTMWILHLNVLFSGICAKEWLDQVTGMCYVASWSVCWNCKQKAVHVWEILVMIKLRMEWRE